MSTLWPLVLITFKEGIRNKVFYSISLVALLLVGANLLLCSMIPQNVGKVAVDMALSTISFTGLLLVLFMGINLVAKDMEKRTIYLVLSRPISRQRYMIGKFLGMTLLIVVAPCVLSLFASLSIFIMKSIYPAYFESFDWSLVLLSILFIIIMLNMLSALTFLFASFATSSFTTLMLTIISYIIGQSLTDVKAIVEAPQPVGIEVSRVTVKMVQTAYYLFPNLSLFDIKTQAAHGLSIPGSYIFWVIAYGVVYTCLTVAIASIIFRKKEML